MITPQTIQVNTPVLGHNSGPLKLPPDWLENDDNLAIELFGPDAVMALPDASSPNDWPMTPAHTCGATNSTGTVITMRDTYTTAARMITPAWRDNEARQGCPACYHRRVLRYCRQIEVEKEAGQLWSIQIGGDEYKRMGATWRKRATRGADVRYCPFPQPDNQYTIVHNQEKDGGQAIPNDRAELYHFVYQVAKTPEDKRVSPSNGWGGNWQGARGDGRVKLAQKVLKAVDAAATIGGCVQLWTKKSLKEIAQRLGAELAKRQHSVKVDINPFDAYQRLADCELHERHTNRLGVTALLEQFGPVDPENGQNVTDNAQSKTKDTLSLKRDILPTKGQGGERSGAAVVPHIAHNTPLFPKALQHRAVSYSPGGRNVAF